MSTTPPNVPGGTPPYDPKMQWRIYREQQKAAWRAQRDAWRAQRHAWKYAYGGTPRVPSVVGPIILIGIGVVALLVMTGSLPSGVFWSWYGRWWPLVLIAAGLAMLAEWMIDVRRQTPVRRSGGFVGVLVLLAIVGIFAAGITGSRSWWHGNFGGNGFWNHLGMPEHDFDQQVLNTAVAPNATVVIDVARGDVSIAAGDGPNVQVESHQVAFANSDEDAKKIFDAQAPHATVSEKSVAIRSEGDDNGHVNLTVTVPKTVHVTVNAGRGDVSAAGLGAGVAITAPRGDTRLSAITGPVEMHFVGSKHDFSAHQVNGDITADGNCNDLTFSEIKGHITVDGEILGEVHMENISGPVRLHTSVTQLDLASLPGELTLDSDNLRVIEAKGAVRLVTRDKDVDLSQIYGDTYVEDRTGTVSVAPAGAFGVQVSNSKGDVNLTLPPGASGTVDGNTRNGQIVTDYALTVSGQVNQTVTGRIGSGGPKFVLSAIDGDLRIRRGPPAPPQPPAPGSEVSQHVRHLRPPPSGPVEPVAQ